MAINGYEGGQMPLYQRLPKRGFNKPNRKSYAVVNLGLIQKFIDDKKLDAKAEITEDALVASGLVRRKLDGVRVLGSGEITAKANITVTGASKAAIAFMRTFKLSASCAKLSACTLRRRIVLLKRL